MKKISFLLTLLVSLILIVRCNRPVDTEKAQKLKLRASEYASSGNSTLALTYFDSALYYNFRYTDAYIGKSKILIENRDLNGAIKNINKALKFDGDNGNLYYYKGLIYYQANKFNKAIQNFDKCINYESELKAPAYFYKGVMYKTMGDTIAAKINLRFALDLGYIKAAQLLDDPSKSVRKK